MQPDNDKVDMNMEENSLSPTSITRDLKTRFVGRKAFYYPSLASTNDMAKQEARHGATEGTIIIADEQTSGKGREKRVWLSPKGCIALSIILYPSLIYLPSLIMVASLAVVHAIEEVTGLKAQIKWPNDVIINDKKVCGILIENEVLGERVDYAIIGVGMNVNLRTADYTEIQSIATSLSDELGNNISRLDLIQCLLVEIERLYLTLLSGESIYEEWRDRLATLGKTVQVKMGETTYDGIAEAVVRDGSLLLRQRDGSLTEIVAGDVALRYSKEK